MMTAILALFFLALGLLGMSLPWSPVIRTEVVDFLLSNNLTLSLVGFAFFMMSLGALFQLINGARRHYFRYKIKTVSFEISEKVIRDYLAVYFRDLFPYSEVPCHIVLKKKKAKITADLPHIPKSEQKAMIKKIEGDLGEIFHDLIGYPHELLLAVSFAPQKL